MQELIQNTPEWEEMRKTKIGASDAPVIMGVSPYATPHQLWQKKLGLIMETTHAGMKRGHDLEALARLELEKMTNMLFMPQVKFHPKHEWMMASLDAIDLEQNCIAEIKCPNAEDHELARNGKVPEKYFPQLQHQLEVCQLKRALYFSFDGSSGVIVEVFRDEKYIKEMIKKEQEFYECMIQLTPPALTNRDYVQKTDDTWSNDVSKLKSITQKIEDLELQREELRESLISQCMGQSSMGNGVKVSKVIKKGNIDYSKIPTLSSLDLEPYRKPSSEYWKITLN